MLERLLDILQRGGTYTVHDLAHRLDVTPPLVEMMIEELMRMGYLSIAAMSCAKQCEGCSMGACLVAESSGRIWTWTGEG